MNSVGPRPDVSGPFTATCLLIGTILVAGCLGSAPDAKETPDVRMSLAGDPPVRISDEQAAREPSMVKLPDGTLIAAGYWGATRYSTTALPSEGTTPVTPLVWRSRDAGATWQRLDTGLPVENSFGNSDISLAVDAEGRIYAASLVFGFLLPTIVLAQAPPEAGLPYAVAVNLVAVGVSADGGDSWTWAEPLAIGAWVDRPWVRVAPNGSPHVVWNDGNGIYHSTSSDHGQAWTDANRIYPAGGDGGFDIGPGGELAVRIVPLQGNGLVQPALNEDGVLVSLDNGASWEKRAIPGNRTWVTPGSANHDGVSRAWDPVAFDAAGRLCVAWAEPQILQLACSTDLGVTWTVDRLAGGAGVHPFYPFLRNAPDGLVASWFELEGSDLSAHAARVNSSKVSSVLLRSGLGTANGEYFEVAADGEGVAAAVSVTDSRGQWLDFVAAHPVEA